MRKEAEMKQSKNRKCEKKMRNEAKCEKMILIVIKI